MKSSRQELIIECEVMKERQRCLKAIDELMALYEKKLDEERVHITSMALNKAKDYINS